ncbi:MAG: RNA 2'-phosphotransferase [Clostridia bacterium]|nr:RNA 2'-phosphotransferase [Clostridia bacterium]
MDLTKTSKFLSLILRHKPEVIGITLDEHGWADIDELIDGINAHDNKYNINREILNQIVETDEKQRYAISPDGKLIRANQGHSIPVDVELKETEPPEELFHGTADRFSESIEQQGLLPQSRLYVHLSKDIQTAEKVGMRHGKPVVYSVNSGEMFRQGYKFYISLNGVWLTKNVPPQFLTISKN